VRSRSTLALALVLLAVSTTASGAEDPAAALSLIRPKPAQTAKDFQVATPDKGQLRLADFKGKVIFLNFWATWCEPCKEEMPAMERLYQKYRERGLVVLAISADAEGASVVTPFVKKYKLTFLIGLDPRMSVTSLYGVWAVPSTFIIDKQGKRILFANGPREWDGKAAHALFESLLQ
jgi:peroxiredoxin